MTRLRFTLSMLAFACVGGSAFAQKGNPGAHMLEQWDADADGQVTLEEAVTKRGEVFYMFDADTDGKLSAEEWAMVTQHMADEMATKGKGMAEGLGHGQGPGAAMHKAMTPTFNDADGDGTVTEAEFTAATQKLFPMLDKNGDGIVTQADFSR